jgi:glycosyltransferase involved in cell wall biosynthesis
LVVNIDKTVTAGNFIENKRMKLLLLVGSLNQGGAEHQLLQLAKLLQKRGHEVEIMALTDYNYYLPFIAENNLKYSCISNHGSKFKRLISAITQINKKRPDLVISYIKLVSEVAIFARIISGFKFKLIISERTSLIKPLHDIYYFNLALLANIVTVNSISKYNYIRKRFSLLKKRVMFVPNIIDLEKYKKLQKVNSIDGNVRISYIGRISPEKNLLNLIKAIGIIAKEGFNISLTLTGEANNRSYYGEVISLIETLSLNEVVKLNGPTKNVTDVYENTDLLCLISFYEGFSNVLSEALACGIPVIASNIEENRFLVNEGVNGFLVDPYNIDSISAEIRKYLKLTEIQKELISNNNQNKAIEIFNTEKIYLQYLTLFNKLFKK